MKKLLILHCWFGRPDQNWYPYLKTEAEKLGYEVTVPELNDADKPTLKDWTECALKDFELDENTTIVGHSLGGVFALKLVQESAVNIDKLILVSGWDFWDLTPEHKTFFETPVDQAKIASKCNKIQVVHSTNDPYITYVQAQEMAKRLNADFHGVVNGGHLQKDDGFEEFETLVEYLK